MEKLYLIRSAYEPNTATTNRSLAFAKGYGELGIETKVVFTSPNKYRDKVLECYNNVEFIYLWDSFNDTNKYISFFIHRLLLFKFLLKLESSALLILSGTVNSWYLYWFNRNIKIYNEIAENPYITKGTRIIDNMRFKIYKRTIKRIDGFFVISPSLKDFLIENFSISKNKIHVINMIVDTTRFDNVVLKEKKNTITYCGTISENKDGISDLILAFEKVASIYPDITLTIIGGFESNTTKENTFKLLNDIKNKDRVSMIGVVNAELMPRLLLESKILVLSRPNNIQAQYGFPTKLGEYLMTGNPIVVTDVGDFRAYLKDKEDVIFAQPDNSNDFANMLIWTLDNYEQAQDIGENGKKAALVKFNYKTEAQKILNVVLSK